VGLLIRSLWSWGDGGSEVESSCRPLRVRQWFGKVSARERPGSMQLLHIASSAQCWSNFFEWLRELWMWYVCQSFPLLSLASQVVSCLQWWFSSPWCRLTPHLLTKGYRRQRNSPQTEDHLHRRSVAKTHSRLMTWWHFIVSWDHSSASPSCTLSPWAPV